MSKLHAKVILLLHSSTVTMPKKNTAENNKDSDHRSMPGMYWHWKCENLVALFPPSTFSPFRSLSLTNLFVCKCMISALLEDFIAESYRCSPFDCRVGNLFGPSSFILTFGSLLPFGCRQFILVII